MSGSTKAPEYAEETYLSRGEAALRLGVPPRTIQQWAIDGKIPCIRTFGGHRRFSVKDLDAIAHLAKKRRPRRRTTIQSSSVQDTGVEDPPVQNAKSGSGGVGA